MNTIIRLRENNKYQAIISYKNNLGVWKQKSKGGFLRAKDAKEWAKNKSFEIMESIGLNTQDENLTLDELFDLYIENLELKSNRTNTLSLYKATKKFMGDFHISKVKDIKKFDVERYFLNKSKENNRSYKNYLNILKVVLNFAVDDLNIINKNPIKKISLQKNEDTRIKFITEELYQKILDKAKDDDIKLFLKVAYQTGMRYSEIVGLTIFNISPTFIKVDKQYNELTKTFEPLKTKNSYREIPITKNLYDELLGLSKIRNDRLFSKVYPNKLSRFLSKYNTSIHCFRHTFATKLVSSNIELTIAAKILGDTIQTMINTYTETNEDMVKQTFEKVRKINEV